MDDADPNDDRTTVTATGPPSRPSAIRRALDAVRPRGARQVTVGIVALCFLAGALGYLVGTRSSTPTSAVDVGFLLDMSDHHDQAVSMSLCATDRATDPVTRGFAREVLVFQNRELGRMQELLTDRGVERPNDEDRPAMAWMGMQSMVSTMPGMATRQQVNDLCAATGLAVDRQFLTLMRDHHLGGAHMADDAAANAADPRVRSLAAVMARNQRAEANEYAATLQKLGN